MNEAKKAFNPLFNLPSMSWESRNMATPINPSRETGKIWDVRYRLWMLQKFKVSGKSKRTASTLKVK